MSQIITKFITPNNVDDTLIRLRNNDALRARNQANSADVNILHVDTSNVTQFDQLPQANFTPSNPTDLANKSYVDSAVAASSGHDAVVTVSLTNLTLSGEQTINGVTTSASRILVAGQTTGANNGVYVTGSGAWTRATDFASGATPYSGTAFYVNQGTYANTVYVLSNVDPITVGTTALTFARATHLSNIETFTLASGDITNQYVTLAQLIIASSLTLRVKGAGSLLEGSSYDYTMTTSGGVSRLNFQNDLATGGAAALVSGDILQVIYRY